MTVLCFSGENVLTVKVQVSNRIPRKQEGIQTQRLFDSLQMSLLSIYDCNLGGDCTCTNGADLVSV